MITIQFKDGGIGLALERLQHKLGDLSPALEEIGRTLEQRARTRFETETSPDGRPWAPWQPATYFAREGRGKLLHDTGHMLDGISHQVGPNQVTIGADKPYAVFHEYGTSKMPARRFLTTNPEAGTLGEDDEQTVLDIIERHLAGT